MHQPCAVVLNSDAYSGCSPLFGRASFLTTNVLELADSGAHAFALCTRLRGSLLREEQRTSTFLQSIPDLEAALMSRRATVDAAVRAPGATADSVVDSIIAESYAVVSATARTCLAAPLRVAPRRRSPWPAPRRCRTRCSTRASVS